VSTALVVIAASAVAVRVVARTCSALPGPFLGTA